MIRRLIQLVLDANAAKKLEREVDRSMGRIARESESKMKVAFRRIGLAVAAAFSVRAVTRFAREMLRLGSSAEETASKFGTVFGQERAAELDGFLDRFARIAGLTRTEGREMLANFGAIFQGAGLAADASADLSEQAVRMAADFQSFHDIPIAETFAAIRSGATGEAEPLKRLGIILRAVDVDTLALANSNKTLAKDLTEQERVVARMQLIYEKAGVAVGDLARTQDSTANRVRNLTTWFRQLREDLAIGLLPVFRLAVIEIGNASGLFDGLSGAVQGLTVWIRENLAAIRDWGVAVVRVAQATIETVRFMARMVINSFDVIGTSLALWLAGARQDVARLVNSVIEGFNKIPGVDIEFRMNQLTPEEFAEQQRLLQEDIAGNAADMADALGDLAESYRDVGRAAVEAATGQREAASVPPPAPVVPPPTPGGDGEDDDELEEANARFLRRLETQARAAEAAKKFRDKEMQELRDAAVPVAQEMTAAFETFFLSAATGFEAQGGIWAAAGDAAREAGAAIVSGLVAGRAEEQIAQGTAALASGLWPPNPAAIAASLKHFAAAALFKAIPGAIAGRGGGSGVGGGGSIPRGALGTSVPGTRDVPGPEIHVYLDQLSPADPRFQRVVLGAVQNAQERFGPSVRVNLHPRSSA
jgi:hypothetical protein